MDLFHFIYKTKHINGKYYIGRHSTFDLEDGYIGSGKWVKSINDRSTLAREILEYVDNEHDLKLLEQKYIDENFGKPNCMNFKKSSLGFGPYDSQKYNKLQLENGTHLSQNKLLCRKGGVKGIQSQLKSGLHASQKPGICSKAGKEGVKSQLSNGAHHTQVLHTCPKCKIQGYGNFMYRWHFSNCTGKPRKRGRKN